MAVQIFNDMPDAEVHRGEPFAVSLRELNLPRAPRPRLSGRAIFLGITVALHVVFALAFMQVQAPQRVPEQATPIMASLLEEAPPVEPPPPVAEPQSNPVKSKPGAVRPPDDGPAPLAAASARFSEYCPKRS